MLGRNSRKNVNRQKALRNNMTDAERLLWRLLRGRQFSGLKFRRQHPFQDYYLDFVCLEKRLVIEVDGSQHLNQDEYDQKRTDELAKAGFKVLRLWNHEVLKESESVKEKIWRTVQSI
jgi:very-short-patch-repair endonuclease